MKTQSEKSKLFRYVRYIYRKMMSVHGKQFTRENGLKLYVLTTREKARNDSHFSNDFINGVLDLCIEWGITPKMWLDDGSLDDLTPIKVRVRKLTPRECLRLQGVPEEDIDKMIASGLSNSALYKLAGNSICLAPMKAMFTQLFRADSDCLF